MHCNTKKACMFIKKQPLKNCYLTPGINEFSSFGLIKTEFVLKKRLVYHSGDTNLLLFFSYFEQWIKTFSL